VQLQRRHGRRSASNPRVLLLKRAGTNHADQDENLGRRGHAAVAGAAGAAGVPGQGTRETALQPRDLDADTITDAFYDTELNITGLRNANANGLMNWDAANTWAVTLVVGAYSDWRLPTIVDTGAPGCNESSAGGTDCGYNEQTRTGATVCSEMAHLHHAALGQQGVLGSRLRYRPTTELGPDQHR
jgi:hypothetical protein